MRQFKIFLLPFFAMVLLLATFASSLAATPPDTAEMLRIVRALESRIDALERQVESMQAGSNVVEAALTADAPAGLSKPQSAGPAAANAESYRIASLGASPDASGAYDTPAAQAPSRPWDGWYFGGSVVAGITQASLDLSAKTSDSQGNVTNVHSTTDQTIGGGGGLEFFGGVNRRLSNTVVAGVQLSGAITDTDFSSKGSARYEYRGNGDREFASFPFEPRVHARWMASAIGRLGWVADETLLLYGLAGYTLSRFDSEFERFPAYPVDEKDNDFFGHGLTVGMGVERQLAGPWSLKAEYQFTHFLSEDVLNEASYKSTFGSGSASSSASFENDLHSLRFGLAYQLPSN